MIFEWDVNVIVKRILFLESPLLREQFSVIPHG